MKKTTKPITTKEYNLILQECRNLPAAPDSYTVSDFIENLFLIVFDSRLENKVAAEALKHYRTNQWAYIRNLQDLKRLFSEYENDKNGNSALARYLWGKNHGHRIPILRKLVSYYESVGVISQETLRKWAAGSDFAKDLRGKLPVITYDDYRWLIMRQGLDLIKPHVYVKTFVVSIIGRSNFTDSNLSEVLGKIARQLGIKSYVLDWRITEFQRDKVKI